MPTGEHTDRAEARWIYETPSENGRVRWVV